MAERERIEALEKLLISPVLSDWHEESHTWRRATFSTDTLEEIQRHVLEMGDMTATANQWEGAFKAERKRAEQAEARLQAAEEALRKIAELPTDTASGNCNFARMTAKAALTAAASVPANKETPDANA